MTDSPRYMIATPDRQVVLTPGGRVCLGRDATNDLVVCDATVSRHHARIEWPRGLPRPIVVDLASQNGTFVDGQRVVGRAALGERVALSIGTALLRVELEAPARPSAPIPLLCRLVTEAASGGGPNDDVTTPMRRRRA